MEIAARNDYEINVMFLQKSCLYYSSRKVGNVCYPVFLVAYGRNF
jgi:hypothetical protein